MRTSELTAPVLRMCAVAFTVPAAPVSQWPVSYAEEESAVRILDNMPDLNAAFAMTKDAFDTAIRAEQEGLSRFASAIMRKFLISWVNQSGFPVGTAHAHFVACAPTEWTLDVTDSDISVLKAKSTRNEAGYKSQNAEKAYSKYNRAAQKFGRPYI